ncbi:MAG: hypothetical protein ABI645_15120 [Pseudomonadota bacterium]
MHSYRFVQLKWAVALLLLSACATGGAPGSLSQPDNEAERQPLIDAFAKLREATSVQVVLVSGLFVMDTPLSLKNVEGPGCVYESRQGKAISNLLNELSASVVRIKTGPRPMVLYPYMGIKFFNRDVLLDSFYFPKSLTGLAAQQGEFSRGGVVIDSTLHDRLVKWVGRPDVAKISDFLRSNGNCLI